MGKADGFYPGEVMQFINRHIHGPKQEIGHIDLLQKFSYIEVPERDAEKVMSAINGTHYKGREVRCNDADSTKEERGRRNNSPRKDNGGQKRRGRDDWKALMNGDFKDEEPDFSEEGWARRYPKKK